MKELASDTIYRDLKERGLAFSSISELIVPVSPPLQKGIMSKFTSVFSRKTEEVINDKIITLPILNSAFIVARRQMIYLYKYTIQEENSQIDIQPIQTLALPYEISEISSCDPKFVQDRGDVPLLVRSKTGVSLFVFDVKETALREKNTIKHENLLGVGWISEKECLLLDSLNVTHLAVVQGIIHKKSGMPAHLKIPEASVVTGTWIIGQAEEEQDSKVIIFYTFTAKEMEKQKNPPMKLKVKEFVRTLDGALIRSSSREDYQIESNSLEYRDSFFIVGVGDYFCLQMASEVAVVKKKFDKYMFLDTMAEVMNGFKIRLGSKGMVSSIGPKLLELNCIQFADPKCVSRICDIIEFPENLMELHQNYKEMWPILIRKQYSLMFVFLKENVISLCTLVKMEPMEKVLALANKSSSEPLEVIQDIAQNLGICRKDFYLKLWSTSKKQNGDIYKFLLPCKDVASIKKQLKSLLRRRTISVSQMLKILQKIDGIIDQYLKSDLNQKNLKQYVKNDFLRRKLKLNEMDKMMDHRIFQKIYSSKLIGLFDDIVSDQLDPRPIIIDPLHAMVDQEPYRQLKSLENVFQEFKVILLENYKQFLIEFLEKFPNKLLEVLSVFHFLLPNYPFQIEIQKPLKTNETIIKDPKAIHNDQPVWFQEITVAEWQTELTKQRILKKLYDDYPTSKIVETVDQFFCSLYGRENKIWKHGLITLDLDEYARKISELKGIKLYLDVCQFSNELAIKNGTPCICNQIVETLELKNKLKQPAIHDCKLYGLMHYFMLKNQIIPKEKLEISKLTKLKPENLVALFFLENKQRKEHIFNQFKDLYEDKNEFKDVLQQFVRSENCSRIELQILMKEVTAKGVQFQQKNQDIIELLIIGLCMKVEIREKLSILEADEYQNENNPTLLENVSLSKHLALKVNRIKQLKRCLGIFKTFGLDKMTFQDLLQLEEDNKIFKILMDKFFEEREKEEEGECLKVVIEGDLISLDNAKNMLTVLVYLQETVYYSTRTFELLILYGLELILWKEFQVIKDIIADESTLNTIDIDRTEFMQNLISRALDSIYLDTEIIFDEETKQQIVNILNIDDDLSCIKIRELAKLQIVEVFESWKLEVHPCDIHTICHEWKQHNRNTFVIDLINVYNENLDFKTFQNIYLHLEMTEKETREVTCMNDEYVEFCNIYAHKLMEKKRYQEVIEVLTYIMSSYDIQVSFVLLAQAFLKSSCNKFAENIETGRQILEFFIQKYNSQDIYNIKNLLETYFDETVLTLWERQTSIFIDSRFLYKEAKGMCEFPLDDLWKIAEQESKGTEELYYNYFFLMISLSNPGVGLIYVSGISYNLQKITNIFLQHVENYIGKRPELWLTDYDHLLRKYMEGIMRQAYLRLEIDQERDKAETTKVDIVLDLLRTRRNENGNEKFTAIFSKVKAEVQNKSKRNSRKERFKKKLKEIEEREMLKKKQKQAQQQNEPIEEPVEPEIFLNWKVIEEEKKIITSRSQIFLTEKDMIEQIYEVMLSNNHPVAEMSKNKHHNEKQSLFSNLFLPTVKSMDDINLIVEIIKKGGQVERISQYPLQIVVQAIKRVSEDEEYEFADMIEFMNSANIGDITKREISKITKFFKGSLPDKFLKHIFSVDYLMQPLECTEDEKYEVIYREIKPRILDLIPEISCQNLHNLAILMENSLESAEYSSEVYYEALLWLGPIASFDSHYAILAQQCVNGLGKYSVLVSQRYQMILQHITADPQMKIFIRENLSKLMLQQGFEELAKDIRNY